MSRLPPLSILDRAMVRAGEPGDPTLRAVVDRAQGADELLLTGSTYDVEDQAPSDRWLAAMGQRRDDADSPRP